jgi:LPS-assembly protein
MMGLHKFSLKTFQPGLLTLAMFCAVTSHAQKTGAPPTRIDSTLTADSVAAAKNLTPAQRDSVRLARRTQTFIAGDTTKMTVSRRPGDTTLTRIDTFNLRLSRDTLTAPVTYEAEDSAVVLAVEKRLILYGKTRTTYEDVILTAPRVELDQKTNILTAVADRDSLGDIVTRAKFEQKENNFESDTIRYNFKTQRGLTRNTFTTQNEMFIQGETIKKADSVTVYISRGRFTTCDYDEPHFAFRANKLKVINNKVAISGPMHPEFEGVPIPIYLPFGYYPLSSHRHSGLLAPQFAATENQGIGLQGLGYYHVLNQNYDVTLRGDLYSYGSWAANLTTSYRVRYRYNGAFNFSLQNTKVNFKGDPDYFKAKTFSIRWNHGVDQRARPGVSFSASVNAGSTKYNRLQMSNPQRNFENQLGSSIAYMKTWKDKPFNLTLAANHSQNNTTRLINVTLPDASFTMNTIYPFERKHPIGDARWYEKIGAGYRGAFQNRVSFFDTAFSARQLLDTLQWAVQHELPLTISLPSLGPLIITPGISFQQQWMMQRQTQRLNATTDKVDTTVSKGLYTATSVQAGIGVSTAFFGKFVVNKATNAVIRHTVRPQFSMNYAPNLARGYYGSVKDSANGVSRPYNMYLGNLYTGYANQEFGGMSFGIDNILEMKKRSRTDSTDKRIRLIDGFGFSSSYNFLQKERKLGEFFLYLRSTLFDKINLTVNSNLTPYAYDTLGNPVDRYVWKDGFKLGRLTSGSLSLSTSFRSKPRDPSKSSQPTHTNSVNVNDPTLLADQQRLLDYMRRNPNEFVDFNIPYDFSVDLAITFARPFDLVRKVFRTEFHSSINFRNSFSLTPKWNFSTNGYLNLDDKKLEQFTLAINREMHCWQLSIGVTPVGYQRSFNISLSPKSSLLQNLRINRTRVFTDY